MQKTNFKTRLLALLTAAFMIVMCVPFAAFADDAVMTINYYVDNQLLVRILSSRKMKLGLCAML